MKTIEIIITPTGDVSIDAVGFKGNDCEQATKFLEHALGANTRRVQKPEYHQQVIGRQQQGLG